MIIIVAGLVAFGRLCRLIVEANSPQRGVYLCALILGVLLGFGHFAEAGFLEAGAPEILGKNRRLFFYGYLLSSCSIGLLLTYIGASVLVRTSLLKRSSQSEQCHADTESAKAARAPRTGTPASRSLRLEALGAAENIPMSEDREKKPSQNTWASSSNLPEDHPLKTMSQEELRAEMRRSQKDSVAIQLEAFAEPESLQHIARFSRGLYLALVEEGFSEDQALEIVKSIGLPARR